MSSSGLNPNPDAARVEETLSARPAPVTDAPVEEVLAQISVERPGKGGGLWLLRVYADRITATASDDGEVHTVRRSELGERVAIAPMGQDAMLTLRAEKITLKLAGEDLESLRRHLGADLQTWALQLSLRETKTSLWSGLGLSALWFLGEGRLFLGVLALAYLIAGVGRLFRGGRWLFLLSGLRAVALLATIAIDVFVFDAPWWLGLLGLLFLFGANIAFRRFAFFRPWR